MGYRGTSPLRHVSSGGERAVVALANRGGWLSAFGIAAGLGGAWIATYAAGGTHTVMPHLFYVPVVAAAHRFRHFGALTVATVAGLLAGPLLPLDVQSGTSQQLYGWLLRMGFFLLTGQVVALLSHRSVESLSRAVSDRRLSADLNRGLERGEFHVVYQPLVELATGVTTGFEALLRWDHPDRGPVAPMEFIETAERTGAIVPIGTFVLREALSQLGTWRNVYGQNLKVAVNLSARQLEEQDLVAEVARALSDTGVPPAALQLEVTETALIADWVIAEIRLAQLRKLGVTIAIDDFGTGQSSLAYLHHFQADVIKIDRAFVAALEQQSQARRVAQGVVRLAAGMGATTVGEGIETQAQADILRHLGCHIGQGYLYAYPQRAGSLPQAFLTQSPIPSPPADTTVSIDLAPIATALSWHEQEDSHKVSRNPG